MRNAIDESAIQNAESRIELVLDRQAAIPAQIFKPHLTHFRFLPFESVLMHDLFLALQKFCVAQRQDVFMLASLEPSLQYYRGHFGAGGLFEFEAGDAPDQYLEALHRIPEASHADSLACNATQLFIGSRSTQWAVVADRDADLVLCAFAEEDDALLFEGLTASCLLGDAAAAAEHAYGENGQTGNALAFLANYGAGD